MAKSNPMQVYVHYMPWFKSKEYAGAWGLHWTMRNQNPDRVLPNGNREIASHYYPLIGPYDSADPDVKIKAAFTLTTNGHTSDGADGSVENKSGSTVP
jgi:hypothetical protein